VQEVSTALFDKGAQRLSALEKRPFQLSFNSSLRVEEQCVVTRASSLFRRLIMSEQENLQTVQRFYKLFIQGDLAALLNLTTDDVEFFPPVSAAAHAAEALKAPRAYPWRGRKEVEQYFKALAEALEFQELNADEFIVGRDSVVVLGHERCLVRATGRIVEAKWVQIFDFRDGLICRHREYTDTAAWDAGLQMV
jgi:ketosteroid isomerase-like protein